MISRAITHPLDTLRVLQSVSSHSPSAELVKGTQQEVPVIQRLSAATGHWLQTAARALSDGRGILRTATFNWHQLHGLESANPVYDTLQLRQSVSILYRGYGVSVFGAQPVFGAYFTAYEVKHDISSCTRHTLPTNATDSQSHGLTPHGLLQVCLRRSPRSRSLPPCRMTGNARRSCRPLALARSLPHRHRAAHRRPITHTDGFAPSWPRPLSHLQMLLARAC
jgi:hypothetical protein